MVVTKIDAKAPKTNGLLRRGPEYDLETNAKINAANIDLDGPSRLERIISLRPSWAISSQTKGASKHAKNIQKS